MKMLILASCAVLSLSGFAQAHEATEKNSKHMSAATQALSPVLSGAYDLDKTHASLTWKVQHMGLAYYTARFTDFDIDLTFDAEHPQNSTVSATINPASVRTDYPNPEKEDFDKVLANDARWFNADAFPKITFTATGIELSGDKTGHVTGDLNFLGVSKPVTLDVALSGSHEKHPSSRIPALGFSATTTIKRSDWGLNTYLPAIVGDDVQIIIEAEFSKKKE